MLLPPSSSGMRKIRMAGIDRPRTPRTYMHAIAAERRRYDTDPARRRWVIGAAVYHVMTSRNHNCWPRALNRGYLGLIPAWIVHDGAPFLGTALGGQPPATAVSHRPRRSATDHGDRPPTTLPESTRRGTMIKESSTERLADQSPDPAPSPPPRTNRARRTPRCKPAPGTRSVTPDQV